MTYEYDPDADCAYVRINDLPHAFSRQVDDARFVDYAADGTVIGIELLYVGSGVDISDLPFADQVGGLLEEHRVRVEGRWP